MNNPARFSPPKRAVHNDNSLPLRSPSPTKTKMIQVKSPMKHKRIPSIDLPPSKRQIMHRRSSHAASSFPQRQYHNPQSAPPFPGIWQALLQQNDLLLIITTEYINPHDLFKLYCIDRDFYKIVNTHATTWIRGAGRNWARVERPLHFTDTSESRKGKFVNAMRYAPVGCYHHLCNTETEVVHLRSDHHPDTPALRMGNLELTPSNPVPVTAAGFPPLPGQVATALPVTHNNEPTSESSNVPAADTTGTNTGPRLIKRYVPTFKYLFMVMSRLKVVRSVLRTLAWDHGMNFPAFMGCTLLKVWFLMDVRLNGMRRAFLASEVWFTKFDILRSLMFFVKLDCVFNDTITDNPSPWLRRLIMSHKGFAALDRLLLRTRFKYKHTIEVECAKLMAGPGTDRLRLFHREYLNWEASAFRHNKGLAYIGPLGFIIVSQRSPEELESPDTMILSEAAHRHIPIGKREITFFITYGYPRRVTPAEIEGLEGIWGLTKEKLAKLPSTEQRPFWWKAFRDMCRFDKPMHWAFDLTREGLAVPQKYWSSEQRDVLEDLNRQETDSVIDFRTGEVRRAPPPKSLMPKVPGSETIMDIVARVTKSAGLSASPLPLPQPSAPPSAATNEAFNDPDAMETEPVEQEPTVVHQDVTAEDMTMTMADLADFDQSSDEELE